MREPLEWYDENTDNPPWIKALAEVRRLTAMVAANFAVLNIRPGAGAYGVTPAHVAIEKRDNAVSFAFWRSEPNRILRVLEATVPSGAIF
jgi:hypothetical protein